MEILQAMFDSAFAFGRTTVTLEPSGVTFQVDVANTPEQRARGMVGRSFSDDVPAMLFIEPTETFAKFHMKNVDSNLVLAIFNRDGKFLEAIRMGANSTTITHAYGFKFALEMSPDLHKSIDLTDQVLKIG